MNVSRLTCLALTVFLFFFVSNCSDDKVTTPEVMIANEDDMDDVEPDDDTMEEEDMDDDADSNDSDSSTLVERFVFEGEIVIENSWNTGGCDSPPCDTNDESLDDFFIDGQPDDSYFSLNDDESELSLECQLEKGRRIEFKQRSEGPLTSLSRMEFEGVYYDIPQNGVTIAQVHNRGGSGNKPFFRLVLKQDGLETVLRKDPEVSSSDTSFQKEDFSFVGGENYDQSPLKIVLEKSEGLVKLSVEQNDEVILDESFLPDSTTRWVSDSGIANGYYLKAGLYNDDGPHTKNLVVGYSTFKFQTEDQ